MPFCVPYNFFSKIIFKGREYKGMISKVLLLFESCVIMHIMIESFLTFLLNLETRKSC